MISLWRICKAKYAKDAFNGTGAKSFGGRWNSPGLSAVYLGASAASAILEMIVHTDKDGLKLPYVLIEARVDPALVTDLKVSKLSRNWIARQAVTRKIGDAWLRKGAGLLLRIPSAIVPMESNYLLNPRHPALAKVIVGPARRFRPDTRLSGK